MGLSQNENVGRGISPPPMTLRKLRRNFQNHIFVPFMSPHVLDVWENHCTCMTDAGAVTGRGMVSLPCGTGEKCLNFTKPQKMLFYWFSFVQDSSKNKKHVCLVKDNKLSFPVIHAFHFCRKMDGREHQHFLRFWKFLRTFRRLHREEIPSPGP